MLFRAVCDPFENKRQIEPQAILQHNRRTGKSLNLALNDPPDNPSLNPFQEVRSVFPLMGQKLNSVSRLMLFIYI